MAALIYQADIQRAKRLLRNIIAQRVRQDGLQWLDQVSEKLTGDQSQRSFYLAFGAVPRKLPKDSMEFHEEEKQTFNTLRKGFNPNNWTIQQAARVLLILSLPHEDCDFFVNTLEQVFDTADINEQVALYASLPLLPYPEAFVNRAAEGIRTNIRDVFDAVVLNNPFPHDFLPENAWNQMVLKAIFTERPLYKIYGLDKRSNSRLARILSDYAHERWAAHRVVTPELWRAVGSHIDEVIVEDIKKLLNNNDPLQQQAGALLCAASNSNEINALLETHPMMKKEIENKTLTWNIIAEKWWGL